MKHRDDVVFQHWMRAVKEQVARQTVARLSDLPEQPWRAWHAKGMKASRAADKTLEDAGYNLDP